MNQVKINVDLKSKLGFLTLIAYIAVYSSLLVKLNFLRTKKKKIIK